MILKKQFKEAARPANSPYVEDKMYLEGEDDGSGWGAWQEEKPQISPSEEMVREEGQSQVPSFSDKRISPLAQLPRPSHERHYQNGLLPLPLYQFQKKKEGDWVSGNM